MEEISLRTSSSNPSSAATSPRQGGSLVRSPEVVVDAPTINSKIAVGGLAKGNPARVFRAVRHVKQKATKYRFEILVEELRLKTPHEAQVAVEWIRGTRRSRTREVRNLNSKTGSFCSFSDCNPLALLVTLFNGSANNPNSTSLAGSLSARSSRNRFNTCDISDFPMSEVQGGLFSSGFRGRFVSADQAERRGGGGWTTTHVNDELSPQNEFAVKEARIEVLDFSGFKRRGSTVGKRSTVASQAAPSVLAEAKFDLSQHADAVFPNFRRLTVPLTRSLDGQAKITFLLSCIPIESNSTAWKIPYLLGPCAPREIPQSPVSNMRRLDLAKLPSPIESAASETEETDSDSSTSSSAAASAPPPLSRLGGSTLTGAELDPKHTDTVDDHSKKKVAVQHSVGASILPSIPLTTSTSFARTKSRERSHFKPPIAKGSSTARAVLGGGANGGSRRRALLDGEAGAAEIVGTVHSVLQDRMKRIEAELAEKDATLTEMKEKERADLREFEATIAKERSAASAAQAQHKTALDLRDDQVTKLLKQLEDMHDALDRAQKQNDLQREELESQLRRRQARSQTTSPLSVPSASPPTTPQLTPRFAAQGSRASASPVVVALREEIKNLKKRVKDATSQTAAYHQALDLESGKRNKMLLDIEKKCHAQKKAWIDQKCTLEAKVGELEGQVTLLQQEKEAEKQARTFAEKQAAGMRLQLANNNGDGSPQLVEAIEDAQRELTELAKARDELLKQKGESDRRHTQQVAMLKTVAGQYQEELAIEKQHFETERKTLRNRVLELENEMANLPRASVAQRLNSQQTATELQTKLADLQQQQKEQQANPDKHLRPATRLGDPRTALGLAQRLVELEDDLIKTKLALAESETMREQEVDRARKRNVILREQVKEYSLLVSELEGQMVEQKSRMGRRPLKLKRLRSSKSFAGGRASFDARDDEGALQTLSSTAPPSLVQQARNPRRNKTLKAGEVLL